MLSEIRERGETGEGILTFDVPDEALERAAAVADGRAMTSPIARTGMSAVVFAR